MNRFPSPPSPRTRPGAAARALLCALACLPGLSANVTALGAASPATPTVGAGGESTEVRLSVGERALLECLRAATPETVTVGSGPLSAELTLLDPSEVSLRDGRASFKI